MSKSKNTSFWLFTLVITIAFSLLLWLQFSYISRTRTTIINQFSDAVQRSLYRTVKSVEEAEVLTYIDESFKNDTPEARKAKEAIKKAIKNGIELNNSFVGYISIYVFDKQDENLSIFEFSLTLTI